MGSRKKYAFESGGGVNHARLHFSIFVIHLMIRLRLLELSSAILAVDQVNMLRICH